MEKYSSAVSEMYSQFKQREAHPLEKYIGRLVMCYGEELEVVGYVCDNGGTAMLILDASKIRARTWDYPDAEDVVFKRCDAYCYVAVNDLIDYRYE